MSDSGRDMFIPGKATIQGCRKSRTITTVEELDALPDGIILKCGGVTYEHHDGWFHGVDGSNVTAELISLPAAILWEPEAEVGAWSA